MNIEEVRNLCRDTALLNGFKLDVPVERNTRLSRTLGRVKFQKEGSLCVPVKIEFSDRILKCHDSDVVEIIMHEMAHFFVLKETGKNHGHDTEWKRWALKLGCTPKASVKIPCLYDYESEESYRYIIRCSKCNRTVGMYKRASAVVKNFKRYRSSCCNAKIIVTDSKK